MKALVGIAASLLFALATLGMAGHVVYAILEDMGALSSVLWWVPTLIVLSVVMGATDAPNPFAEMD